MIVHWISDERRWEIVHYSHSFDDAMRIFNAVDAKYSNVRLMIDVRANEVYEQRLKIEKIKKQMKAKKDGSDKDS
jgi:hypothetical protein